MKRSVEHATKKKARRSTGCAIARHASVPSVRAVIVLVNILCEVGFPSFSVSVFD